MLLHKATFPARLGRRAGLVTQAGFTLIEAMITVVLIAVLAAVAVPAYSDYSIRGELTQAANGLTAMSASMERYYQDNRTYAAVTGANAATPPCLTSSTVGHFTVVCATPTATAYTLTATGTTGSIVAQFAYTLNEAGTKATTATKAGWGGTCATAWLMKKGDTCP